MEKKKWSFQKILIIPVIVFAFIAYISLTSNETKLEQNDTDPESRLEHTLSQIKGVGQVEVYFHYDNNTTTSNADSMLSDYFRSSSNGTTVSGLLVVSEGASEPAIKKELLETISRVMQMPTHRIMIVPMESKGDEQ